MSLALPLVLTSVIRLQQNLDQTIDRSSVQIETLAQLPQGEYLKPALLGYHHLGADIIWLKLVQVIGKKRNTSDEYEWMYHALDVITTLDPQYAYSYYAGGVILGDLANRPDLSNRLLIRGTHANPTVWNIPFLLGYNYYFLLGDAAKGAEYIMRAASLPGGPSYLPGLATRMAAESGNPETALVFLDARLRETSDPVMREFFYNRIKLVIIERDIQVIERAMEIYQARHQKLPTILSALVKDGIIPGLPLEPFGGEYRIDVSTGKVSSSTHPERLRTFDIRKRQANNLSSNIKQPAYVFPKSW